MKYRNMYAVSQCHCGHEYCWIFDEATVEKNVGKVPESGERFCEDILWPMGGSNSSATFIRKLESLDEAYGFLVNECDGPDLEDPTLVDIAEYLRTIEIDEGSITQKVLDHFGLKAQDLVKYDSRYEELLSLGFTPKDFYGDKRDLRYSKASERKAG